MRCIVPIVVINGYILMDFSFESREYNKLIKTYIEPKKEENKNAHCDTPKIHVISFIQLNNYLRK